MRQGRRDFLLAAAGTAFLNDVPAAAWPERPLKLTIGFPPGGAADGAARPLLPALEATLGQPVVMDYRPGAAGATAAEFVSRSARDGYSIHLIEGSVLTALPSLRRLGFDPGKTLQPLGSACESGTVIVAHPALGVSNLRELIALAKSKPGGLSYGTSGIGGMGHLSAEYFQSFTGTKMLHIPYKGGATAMTDLVGGQVHLLFSSVTPAVPFIKDGKIRALGVTTLARASVLPEVQTLAEQGLDGFESATWLLVAAPRPLPGAVAVRLEQAVAAACSEPGVQAQWRANGFEPLKGNAVETERRIAAETTKWARVIRDAKLTLE